MIHIRRAGGTPRRTLCNRFAEDVPTTTVRHLAWWRRQGAQICLTCHGSFNNGAQGVLAVLADSVQATPLSSAR